MQTLIQDVSYGLRTLRKAPAFASVVVLSLALGIGANAAIFSLISAVMLRPLAYPDADRLAMVWEDASNIGFPQGNPAPANYVDWKAQNQVFADMAAVDWKSFNLTGDGEPQKVQANAVTASFFSVLGINPTLGRTFSAEDEKPGANKVVVLSYELWQSRYGGEIGIVGRDIMLDGVKYTVAGVMPKDFQFLPKYISLWTPIALTPEDWAARDSHYLTIVARLKPGVTMAQANADIKTITEHIAHDYPDQASGLAGYVLPLREQLTGDIQRPFMILLVAVGFVLLIACANIANLLLSRSAARGREMAIRVALGASRGRIVRQLLTESVLLSLMGGALGLLLALWSFAFLQKLIPPVMALSTNLTLDGKVLGFTLLISIATGILFGLAPALLASKTNLNDALKQGSSRTGLGAGNRRLRSAFVVAEIALAVVLLVSAGLLIQTLNKLRGQYEGLRPENLLTVRTALSENAYPEHPQREAFYKAVLERVEHLPGVVSAGYTTAVPLTWKGGTSGFVIEGQSAELSHSNDANHRQVTADYLQTMGIALKAGRYFQENDGPNSQPVVIINEAMARKYWPNEDALGKRFRTGGPNAQRPWMTIIGIVADVRQMGVDTPVKSEMYAPYSQTDYMSWFAPAYLVVRTSVEPTSVIAAVRDQIHAVDPLQPVHNVETMAGILDEETGQRRVGMTLLTVFAALALGLAALGIYGVLAYFVVQHTQEIGVRLALGASPVDILRMVIKKGMAMALLGVGIGLIGAWAFTRLLASLLFGVTAADPLTFIVISLILIGVALLACFVPARRATRVDPMVALRYE